MSAMDGLFNVMRREAARVDNQRGKLRIGLISQYDPNRYAVKVRIQPEDIETGYIPLGSIWVGNQWGVYAPPSIGDMVQVDFQEDDRNAGIAGLRFYNDQDLPLPVPSGEFWLVHKSGSMLKFHNDGSVEVASHGNLTATVSNGGDMVVNVADAGDFNLNVNGQVNLSVDGKVVGDAEEWDITGNMKVTGDVDVTGNVSATEQVSANSMTSTTTVDAGTDVSAAGQVSDFHNTLQHLRANYNAHIHQLADPVTSAPRPPNQD